MEMDCVAVDLVEWHAEGRLPTGWCWSRRLLDMVRFLDEGVETVDALLYFLEQVFDLGPLHCQFYCPSELEAADTLLMRLIGRPICEKDGLEIICRGCLWKC